METLTFMGELAIRTCFCGTRFAVPSELLTHQRHQKESGLSFWIFCPLGHQVTFYGGDTPAQKRAIQLERDLVAERARHDQTRAAVNTARAQRDAAQRREIAQKAAKTRIKNRVKNGVCPCCNRTFTNLQRHMAGQHPEFAKTAE